MALVQELGGHIPASDLHALLFLYCHEFMEHNRYYDFIPQAGGPHSLQAQADKETLVNKGCLELSEDWVTQDGIERFAVPLDFFEKIAIQELKNTWQERTSEALRTHLSNSYPEYFTNANNTSDEPLDPTFYTIGYEGLSPEAYLGKLLENNVKLLCDVRKNAFSQKYGFSKKELKDALEKVGIGYRHIPDLGIVSEKRQELNTPQDYRTLFEEYEAQTLSTQQDKLDLLVRLLDEHTRIAITCFEADVYCCHRSRVASALKQRENFNVPIKHL